MGVVLEWIERRAGLIGVGAIVVAAVALGVAVGSAGTHAPDRVRHVVGPALAERFGGPGLGSGQMPRRYLAGPELPRPGGQLLHRLGGVPGRVPAPLAPGGALHGELTMSAPSGGYQTVDFQRGTVTNISSSSLTVKSADGFTRTYTITKSLASGVSKGDEVQLRATVSAGKLTVTALAALRQAKR
jgi:hypothetical protein